MRVHFALQPGAEAIDELGALSREFGEQLTPHAGRLRPILARDLGLTLVSLGELASCERAGLVAAGTDVARRSRGFELELLAPGLFGTERRGSLALNAARCEALERLASELAQALSARGFRANTRAFAPHLTLARYRGAGEGLLRGAEQLAAGRGLPLRVEVGSFDLFRSTLCPSGPRRSLLESFDLQPREGSGAP